MIAATQLFNQMLKRVKPSAVKSIVKKVGQETSLQNGIKVNRYARRGGDVIKEVQRQDGSKITTTYSPHGGAWKRSVDYKDKDGKSYSLLLDKSGLGKKQNTYVDIHGNQLPPNILCKNPTARELPKLQEDVYKQGYASSILTDHIYPQKLIDPEAAKAYGLNFLG